MSVDVAPGGCLMDGDEQTDQGFYYGYSNAAVNVVVEAANATNPRRDLIVAYVKDAEYAGDINSDADWIDIVKGTAAASPVDPAKPANSISLARIAVAANATSITNANVTDLRAVNGVSARPRGNLVTKTYAANLATYGASATQLTGSDISLTTLAGRVYRYSTVCRIQSTQNAQTHNIQVYRSGTPIGAPITVYLPTTGITYGFFVEATDAPGAAATTYATRAWVINGVGTGSSSSTSTCSLDDVGGYAS